MSSIGVAPMLSALRPMPNTNLRNVVAPNVKWICDIYYKAKEICDKYKLNIGPLCSDCQNNTIALPEYYNKLICNYNSEDRCPHL